jgi:hypothetical protein
VSGEEWASGCRKSKASWCRFGGGVLGVHSSGEVRRLSSGALSPVALRQLRRRDVGGFGEAEL